MSCTEQLISAVKENPILYNCYVKDFGDKVKKEKIWIDIATKLNEKREELESKWHNLIEMYCTHMEIKSEEMHMETTSEENSTPFEWETEMEFLRPFIYPDFTDTSLDIYNISEEQKDLQPHTCPAGKDL